jgi:hypothetical protein
MQHREGLTTKFKEHGWSLLKNIFSAAEISNFRDIANQLKAENYSADLLGHPLTRNILFDERILNVVQQLLDTEDLVYFGDSSCTISKQPGSAHFHKDNPDKINGDGPDWQQEYPVIRLGIYLQNHDRFSGALAIRDKSHKTNNIQIGNPLYVDNQAGDLSVWYLTTTHAGYSKRLKFAPNFFLNTSLYRFIPDSMFVPEEKYRIAYFMTFGKQSPLLDRYLRYLKTREYMVQAWKKSKYDESCFEFAKSKRVHLIDMHSQVKDIDESTLNKGHVELPN